MESSTQATRIEEELRASREQLQVILQGVADGITVLAPDGELLYANEAAARLIGFETVDQLVGTPNHDVMGRFDILTEDGRPLAVDRLPGRRALQGERVTDELIGYRIRATGAERWSLVSATPVFDARGGVRFAITIFRDMTERRRGEETMRFLAEASELLASSLDVEATLTTLTSLIVPALADWCVVDVLETDGVIRQLAVAHRNPEKAELARELRRRYPPDWSRPHPITRVLATGQPEIATSMAPEDLPVTVPGDPENRRLLENLGVRSHMVVPLAAKGRILGALSFIQGESGRQFQPGDLVVAQELARRAGAAMENAQLFRQAEESRERLSFLAEASAVLASSLDYERTLAAVARLAVPRLADWCTVDVVSETGELEEVAVAHIDPAKVEFALEFRRRWPRDPNQASGAPNVVRTGQSEMTPQVTVEMLKAAAQSEEHLQMMLALGIGSVMTVPLTARGRTLGAMTLVGSDPAKPFDQDLLAFAEDVARRAALAVDNARLFRERSRVATTLQRSLLPPDLPLVPGIDLAARYHPATQGTEVGGDFYDVFPTGENRWAVVIGDVCGKGVDAASLTGLVRHTVRATARMQPDAEQVMAALNAEVLLEGAESKFCTVVYASLEPGNGGARLIVTCAGHPLPLLARADGTIRTIGWPGSLLGVIPEPEVSPRTVELTAGDVVALYTDGIVERRSGSDQFGEERLRALVTEHASEPAERIAERIERAVLDFAEGPPKDDMALLVLAVRQP